jgi:DNA-binding transcriptional ArsR family regulator
VVKSADEERNGNEMLVILAALANPQRMRIVAALTGGRVYVSELARMLRISRPLLHMHLQRLEAAGLVSSTLELSSDGKAMRFFSLTPFDLRVTPETVAEAARAMEVSGDG